MSFYLDASFLVTLIVEEVHSATADRWWRLHGGDTKIISGFAAAEVAATLSRGVRTQRFSEAQARAALEDFDSLRGTCEAFAPTIETFSHAEILVRDFVTKLAAPDALHLASAMYAGASLVTFDERLAIAARMSGVDVIVPASTL